MSTNFSEFKKQLGVDPWNRDPEFLRIRNSTPEFEQAAIEAEAFERKLQSALLVPEPAGLLQDILKISQQHHQRRNWIPLALAASLVIAAGTVGIAWKQTQHWDTVESYLADHYSDDGTELIDKAKAPVSEQSIQEIFARLNASADSELSKRIRYIKFCPTPKGEGAHMVVSSGHGPVTVIFMPDSEVTDGEIVNFDGMQAYLLDLEHGSAAIIGTPTQDVASLRTLVKTSLKTGQVDT